MLTGLQLFSTRRVPMLIYSPAFDSTSERGPVRVGDVIKNVGSSNCWFRVTAVPGDDFMRGISLIDGIEYALPAHERWEVKHEDCDVCSGLKWASGKF